MEVLFLAIDRIVFIKPLAGLCVADDQQAAVSAKQAGGIEQSALEKRNGAERQKSETENGTARSNHSAERCDQIDGEGGNQKCREAGDEVFAGVAYRFHFRAGVVGSDQAERENRNGCWQNHLGPSVSVEITGKFR